MKKNFSNKKKLVLSIAVCVLFVTVTFSGVVAKDTKDKPDWDWDYWTNPPHMFSNVSGNVGIGTITPTEKLEVDGNIAVSGTVDGRDVSADGTTLDTVYNWGDHGAVGYLTDESDPVFTASAANDITTGDIDNWDTAFDWGDHASEGYDTTDDAWTGTGNVYTTSGNVGIGTTTPAEKLDVNGNIRLNGILFLQTGTAYIKEIFSEFLEVTNKIFANEVMIDTVSAQTGSGDISFRIPYLAGPSGDKAMCISNSGNIGIGTTDPSTTLHIHNEDPVDSSGQEVLQIDGDYLHTTIGSGPFIGFHQSSTDNLYGKLRGYSFASNNYGLAFDTFQNGDCNTNMVVTGAGNVGIGTTNPSEKLEVAGTVYSTSGGFKFPDGTVQTTASCTTMTPKQIALLQWYEANEAGIGFSVGDAPFGVAFDGANIWVTNDYGGKVSKLRASDGSTVGTYAVGAKPMGIAFDGGYIWIANYGHDTVSKLRASDGSTVGTYSTGNQPFDVAFDGANIWVTNIYDCTVTKLRASDGSTVGTYSTGNAPFGVAFDGTYIWITNVGDDTVSKLRASDGSTVGTYAVGTYPYDVAFDGANIWVTNNYDGTVTKLHASDGSLIGTYSVGTYPSHVVFDGNYIWVTDHRDGEVYKLRAFDGSFIGSYSVGNLGNRCFGIAFDGANIWVANFDLDKVSKL